jgi:predicted nucleotidyltransferase
MRDQTIKADAGKRRLSLVPSQVIYDIAEIREYGNKKYGDSDSWKRVEIDRYIDAAYRHFLAYINDRKGKDEESGIEHYKHLACNIAFICALEANQAYPKSCRVDMDFTPTGDIEGIITKHKQKTCEHEWVVNYSASTDAVAVLKCKKCGKKTLRQNEVAK